jgi:hypothetical protein
MSYNNQQQYTTYNGYPSTSNNYNSNNNMNSHPFVTINGFPNTNQSHNWVTPSSTNINNNDNNSNNAQSSHEQPAPMQNTYINNTGNMQSPGYTSNPPPITNYPTNASEKPTGEKFTYKPYFRDWWALLLFVLTISAFFIVLGLNLYKLNFSAFSNSQFLSVSNDTYIISLVGGIILSLVLSAVYLMWMIK